MPGARAPWRGEAERSLALIRVVALPVILFGERLVDTPQETTGAFPWVFAAAVAYAAAALYLSFAPTRRSPAPTTYVALDLALISALSLASGGETSEVRRVFFLPPVAAAFLLGPRLTAATGAASVAAYLLVGVLDPPVGDLEDPGFALVQATYIGWFGAAAVILAWTLSTRAERIEALAAERGRLVAQAIDAEERERRRISEALHDEAVQNLLAARLDLSEAANGHPESFGRVREEIDRTLTQLRDSVADLHPIALTQAGLAAALSAVAERKERRGGFRASVRADEEASGVCDQLVLSLARELLANAAKHAEAERVSVAVERRGEELVLEVADDGRGIPEGRPERALREGHIGLASSAERVRALSGRFEIESEEGRGTVVRAVIPVAACEVSAPAEAGAGAGQG